MQVNPELFRRIPSISAEKSAVYTTREQEQELVKQLWRHKADAARERKIKTRKAARVAAEKERQKRPERIAKQQAAVAAGTLGPRYVFETMPDGRRRRVVNRPAYIATLPHDDAIDGNRSYLEHAAKRKARVEGGYVHEQDLLVSEVSIPADPTREFSTVFKSKRLGTFAAERWPAMVHRSSGFRVCWHIDERGAVKRQIVEARDSGVPAWMLGEFPIDIDPPEPTDQKLVPARFKILGLDALRVEGNRQVLGFWRIDTDLTWSSVEACAEALEEKVKAGKLRCLPNFMVGLVLPDGRFVRPHMIWLLPPDMGVIANGDPRNLRKFVACYYGFVHALADCGADAQAPATTQQVKNPLNELYHTWCGPDDFYSMKEHAERLDMRQDRDMLIRSTVATLTGETVENSCAFFSACLDVVRPLLAKMHSDRDAMYVQAMQSGDRELLIDRIQEALSVIELERKPGKRKKRIAEEIHRQKAARCIVETWDPTKLSRNRRQGMLKLAHVVGAIPTLKGRQQAAALYSSKKNADDTMTKLVDAHDALSAEGLVVTKSALARRADVSRQTVINRYDALLSTLSERSRRLSKMVPLFYRKETHADPEVIPDADLSSSSAVLPIGWFGDDEDSGLCVLIGGRSSSWGSLDDDPDGPPDFMDFGCDVDDDLNPA